MQNSAAVEEGLSTAYALNYIDAVENLPLDIQREISSIIDIDIQHQALLRGIDDCQSIYSAISSDETKKEKKKRVTERLTGLLVKARELGDEKLHYLSSIQDIIDRKIRELDLNRSSLAIKEEKDTREVSKSPTGEPANVWHHDFQMGASQTPTTSLTERSVSMHNSKLKRPRRRNESGTNSVLGEMGLSDTSLINDGALTSSERTGILRTVSSSSNHKKSMHAASGASGSNATTVNASGARKKKRKQRGGHNNSGGGTPSEDRYQMEQIDPDEPTYCVCNQISFGEMILCDNDLCPIEWFHFSCVALNIKPKGKWFCPHCRGERANVMKPKALFLKELERYNKEKEERT